MHELAGAVHDLDLVRLQVADEVPAERVAVLGMLALEVLRAVLAHDLDPGLDEPPHLLERHVLRRGDDRDAGRGRADLLVAPADLVRRQHGRSPPGGR